MYPALYYFQTKIVLSSETYTDLSRTPVKPQYTEFIRKLFNEYQQKRLSKGGVIPGGQVILTPQNLSNPTLSIPAVKNYLDDVFSDENLNEINRFALMLALSEFKKVFEYLPFSKNSIKINAKDDSGLLFKLLPILQHPFNNFELNINFKSNHYTVLREREESDFYIFSVIESNEFASDINDPNKDQEKDIWLHKTKIERHRVAAR